MIRFYLSLFLCLTINFTVAASTTNPGDGKKNKVENISEVGTTRIINMESATLSAATEAVIFTTKITELQKKIAAKTTKKLTIASVNQTVLSDSKLPCFEF